MPDTAATFADAWHAWLAYRRHSARPLRDSTLADYESIWRCHLEPHLGTCLLAEIDGTVIAGLVVALSTGGARPKRLANILVPLRACLRWHHKMGSFPRDPSAWFEAAPPPPDQRRILTIMQIEALVSATSEHYRAFVTFAAYTGMRLGELRALTWEDIDLEARVARVNKTLYRDRLQHSTKTGHDRTVPLPLHVAQMLLAWRDRCPAPHPNAPPAGYVFPSPAGTAIDADDFRARVWRPAVDAAGLPSGTRIHDLRHTSASLYLQHGATVREVMEIHGWRQLQTAMRYLHTADTLTAAADRLSEARSASVSSTENPLPALLTPSISDAGHG